ncbi:DUF2490 domain-containing protein [Flavobacterium sp. XGLA_31]|uniref:DUF2490 domain-containing protein n=1 Tax=Flavobacterium sp. XGLA_31 TaxID=3447666 RepID=UPI003F35C578
MRRYLFFLFSFLSFGLKAQELKQNQRVWFSYAGQYKVSEHWGYHLDVQFRTDNQLQQNQQNVFRIGGIYFITTSKMLTAGYALANTYNTSLQDFYKENRLWEQFQYIDKWAKNTMMHRFRLEQRWVESITAVDGNVVSLGANYQNRLRYLNKNTFHLTNLRSEKEEIYAVLQDEIFVTLGDNKVNSNIFDQNRFLIGMGLNYNNNIRLELGYMNQFVNANSKADVMNHNIFISLIQNLDLQK